MATLINGDGNPAVYAAQDADLLSGAITNNKTVILDVGEKFSADVLSSSVIEVHDGVILTKEGRRIQLDQNAVDLFEFPAGAQGVVSWYYIGYKLEIDEDSHQICSTFVQKMDTEGDTIPEGSFRDGDQEVYISLYHVQQDTLGVLTPTLVLTENMTMIDVLDNLIGSASDLPDPTKTVTKNIDQINSDLTNKLDKSWISRGNAPGNVGVSFGGEFTDIYIKVNYSSDYMFSMFIPKISTSSIYYFYREGDTHNLCRIGIKQDGAYVSDLYLDDGNVNLNANCTIEVFTRQNSDLTDTLLYDTQTFTPENYGNLYHNAKITRHGNTCMLEIHGFKTLAQNYDNTVFVGGSVREDLRPKQDTTFTLFDPSGTAYRLVLYANGGLKVYMYNNGSGYQNNLIDFVCYVI